MPCRLPKIYRRWRASDDYAECRACREAEVRRRRIAHVAKTSFRDLVDRPNRTGHRKLYDGAEGRTHFDIADFGVGSDPDDEDVAEWLDLIERRFGDMSFRNFFRLEPF